MRRLQRSNAITFACAPPVVGNWLASQGRRRVADWQRRTVQSRSANGGGSALAHRPRVHRAATIRRLRDVDEELVVLAAAEFQELACPFVSGEDAAVHRLGGHWRRSDHKDRHVRRHADGELHARPKGVERNRMRARNSGIAAAAASGSQRGGDENRDSGARERSRISGWRIEIS
jgi:hypothetical protein